MSNGNRVFHHTPASSARNRTRRGLNRRGFSLVELIVIMAILGLLALIAIPTFDVVRDKARNSSCMSEMRDLEKVITSYSIDNGGTYPSDLAAVGKGNDKDPWGRPYQYSYPSIRTDIVPLINSDFDLWSKGADGKDAVDVGDAKSKDDIIRAGEGAYVGIVSAYF